MARGELLSIRRNQRREVRQNAREDIGKRVTPPRSRVEGGAKKQENRPRPYAEGGTTPPHRPHHNPTLRQLFAHSLHAHSSLLMIYFAPPLVLLYNNRAFSPLHAYLNAVTRGSVTYTVLYSQFCDLLYLHVIACCFYSLLFTLW